MREIRRNPANFTWWPQRDSNPCFSLERTDTLPAPTIERPDQKRAELPLVRTGEKLGKRGPLAPSTAGRVGVYAGYLQAQTVGRAPEPGHLRLAGLLPG